LSPPKIDVATPSEVAIAAPGAALPNAPPLELRHAAAVAEFAARIKELNDQRTDLLVLRGDALAEKSRLIRMMEQGKKDLEKSEIAVAEHQLAIAAVDTQLDSFQLASGLPAPQVRQSVRDALALYPQLMKQRAQLVTDLEKHKAESKRIQVRNELSARQLATIPARLEQLNKQAEFLKRQWLRETCDFQGKRTRAEHEAAVEAFGAALEVDVANFGARLGRAVSLIRLNRPAEAAIDLNTADDPSNPFRSEAVAFDGYLKVFEGEEAQGWVEMGRAVTYDRRSLVPHLLRGQAAAHLARFPTATSDFRAAMQLDAVDVEARRLAALYYAAGKYAGSRNAREAASLATRAVELSKKQDWQALLALAASEADDGQFAAAADHADEAADLTFAEHRERCLAIKKQFEAGEPLRLDWTPDGN
jgi:hypothetical protein